MSDSAPTPSPGSAGSSTPPATMSALIPMPVSVTESGGIFTLTPDTGITVEPGTPELLAIGQYLAERLKPATGYDIPVSAAAGPAPEGSISLTTTDGDPALGDEGYVLLITPEGVKVVADQPAGLFRAVQTLRQLFPPAIESATVQPDPWQLPTGTIRDYPRFEWRSMMLDVARHFFGVEDVKRVIDLMAYYKLNRLHLHLSDDQGWRIEITSWPNLAAYGGSTAVGGGQGGYYTQQDYAKIVAYAQSRYITVVPEIDMPGHTNAALASYPELNCDGNAPPLYTGMEVGFSSLCIGQDITYQFVDDVIGELAALTPGPYLHIGGDEAHATGEADYRLFVERTQEIVEQHGKRMVGYAEIARGDLLPATIAQYWNTEPTASASITEALAGQEHLNLVMSPASRTYLDMQYNPSTRLGLNWAGYVEVRDAYDWDPATLLEGIEERDIVGVEALLWTETILTLDDIEYMAFPRLIGIAEIGWSPTAGRSWAEYRVRLAAHGRRLAIMDVNVYHTPQVHW